VLNRRFEQRSAKKWGNGKKEKKEKMGKWENGKAKNLTNNLLELIIWIRPVSMNHASEA
jgi:hypothetical protein